jgi:hypothetical protein
MKARKFKNSQAGALLYRLGVDYHATGTIKDEAGALLFDYYRCDAITDAQRQAIAEVVPDVRFFRTSREYAPEIQRVCVAFPKAAYYRQQATA